MDRGAVLDRLAAAICKLDEVAAVFMALDLEIRTLARQLADEERQHNGNRKYRRSGRRLTAIPPTPRLEDRRHG